VLRRPVTEWARDTEARFARGDTYDPTGGRVTAGEWWQRWQTARVVAGPTRLKDASHWRTHLEPQWATWPLGTVKRLDGGA